MSRHHQAAYGPSLEASDEFRMFVFKVEMCKRRQAHDWQACPFAHEGETARRRCPRTHNYSARFCTAILKTGDCARGDSCGLAHNIFESRLHPNSYRSQMCQDAASGCRRRVCFFAHSAHELRSPGSSPAPAPTAGSPVTAGLQPAAGSSITGLQSPVGLSSTPQQQQVLVISGSSSCCSLATVNSDTVGRPLSAQSPGGSMVQRWLCGCNDGSGQLQALPVRNAFANPGLMQLQQPSAAVGGLVPAWPLLAATAADAAVASRQPMPLGAGGSVLLDELDLIRAAQHAGSGLMSLQLQGQPSPTAVAHQQLWAHQLQQALPNVDATSNLLQLQSLQLQLEHNRRQAAATRLQLASLMPQVPQALLLPDPVAAGQLGV